MGPVNARIRHCHSHARAVEAGQQGSRLDIVYGGLCQAQDGNGRLLPFARAGVPDARDEGGRGAAALSLLTLAALGIAGFLQPLLLMPFFLPIPLIRIGLLFTDVCHNACCPRKPPLARYRKIAGAQRQHAPWAAPPPPAPAPSLQHTLPPSTIPPHRNRGARALPAGHSRSQRVGVPLAAALYRLPTPAVPAASCHWPCRPGPPLERGPGGWCGGWGCLWSALCGKRRGGPSRGQRGARKGAHEAERGGAGTAGAGAGVLGLWGNGRCALLPHPAFWLPRPPCRRGAPARHADGANVPGRLSGRCGAGGRDRGGMGRRAQCPL